MVTILIGLALGILIFSQLSKDTQDSLLDSTIRKIPTVFQLG